MTKKNSNFLAKFEQVLIYADGPQLILLSAPSNTKIIAVAISDYGDYEYPFFGAQVSAEQFLEYLKERFDLRYLLLKPDIRRHFFLDLNSSNDGFIAVEKVKVSFSEMESYVPDPGVFSRAHTEKLNIKISLPQNEEVFGVDGSWDLTEFSHFYNYVTDIYSLFDGVDVYSDKNTGKLQKNQIEAAFIKPFEGGGSYVSLYDSLAATQPLENRLRVGGISYNSPGEVKLKGYAKPFREIRVLIANFEENYSSLQASYKELHQILTQNKWLRMPSSKFKENSKLALVMLKSAKHLSESLGIEYKTLQAMCGNNSLVTAKVLLSMFRRGLKMYEFFLEGRVSFDRPSSQS